MSHLKAGRALLCAASLLVMSGAAMAQTAAPPAPAAPAAPAAAATPETMPAMDADMKAVIDKLTSLGGKPIETLSPEEARDQPSPADAAMAVMEDKKIEAPAADVTTDDMSYTGADGSSVDARVYKPANVTGPLPVIVYIHGGGWVIADIDTYDSSARALAKMTNALVVSVDYRHAPEAKFPAAHDDISSAYQWVLKEAPNWGGDTKKIAVVGESAGGNMAVNLAIAARDNGWAAPLHVVAVYPVASTDPTPSKAKFATAKPLNTPMLDWFVSHTLASPEQKSDTRLNLVNAKLEKLPPTTIILAEIDPLHDEGQMLADKMKAAGVTVDVKDYAGVTHEFFGMGAVVADALDAENYAVSKLKAAFGGAAPQ